MSRRAPNAAADRAAQNQTTIKSLLKLEGNKSCADCKRNKHPRWASWNLGIFVCIRCSGIHRGMGTHISRVKSVDLDAWTDEQLQSVLRWGNARANKYWEAKLAPGHVPSEAKIENFIRTKYESKRWVVEGPIPDPATLDDEGDDNVPLNLVQEKAKLERSASQRVSSGSSQPPPPARRTAPAVDLFGDDAPSPPARPSTTDIPGSRPPPLNFAAPPKQSKPDNSLLGLDFFGTPNSAPPTRSASSASNPLGSSGPSRPDLKQSILSLYASKPSTPAQPQSERQASFGGLQSPLAQPPSSFGGLDDAFSGLSFSSTTSPPAAQPQQQPKSAPFANFTNLTSPRATPAAPQVTPQISGGGFFDTTPKQPPKPATAAKPPPQQPQVQRSFSQSSGFGDFNSAPSTSPPPSKPAPGNALNDMFGFSPSPPPASRTAPPAPTPATAPHLASVFNLSAPTPPPPASAFSTFTTPDPWASNDPWATPDPAPSTAAPHPTSKPLPSPSAPPTAPDFGWAASSTSSATAIHNHNHNHNSAFGHFAAQPPPKIAADEDFGGWATAAPVAASSKGNHATAQPQGGKPGAFGAGSEDLFSNVWE